MGQTVHLTAVPQGGSDLRYEFWRRDPSGVWTKEQGFQPNATLTWMPGQLGTYQWVVYAFDSALSSAPAQCAVLDYTVQAGPLSGVTLSMDPASPVLTGTPLAVTALPVGGKHVLYEFWQQDPNGVWTNPQGWSERATYACQPSLTGTYQWVVYAREANDPTVPVCCAVTTCTVITGHFTGVTLTADPQRALLQHTVNVTATPLGGSDVRYEFWRRDPAGIWTQEQGFRSTNTLSWTPSMVGTYQWVVYAYDTADGQTQCAVLDFPITAPPVHNVSLSTDPSGSTAVNTPVQLTADSQDGNDVQYEFWLRDTQGEWSCKQGYSPNATLPWTPDASGSYRWVVYAIDKDQPLDPANCAVVDMAVIQ
jgi:hypothetical protein